MRGIVNNLRQYQQHSQSTAHDSSMEYRPIVRSLSRRNKQPIEEFVQKSVKGLPRTQQQPNRQRKSFLTTSSLFYEPKGQYRRVPQLEQSGVKMAASTRDSKLLSRTSTTTTVLQPCVPKDLAPTRPRQEAGHTNQLWQLKVNQLFFCVQCYRYVFRIQFDYHYPACKDPVPPSLPLSKRRELAICRLRLIRELLEMLELPSKPQLFELIKLIKEGNTPLAAVKDTRSGYFYLAKDVGSTIYLIWQELLN